MKQKDKELLLKDLCARLPYGVKCNIGEETSYTLCKIEIDDINGHLLDFIETKNSLDIQVYLSEVKPYLFPLSNMTEEQKKEYEYELTYHDYTKGGWVIAKSFENEYIIPYWFVDFCNQNHFDYRGLIEKGLAIDATRLNIY